MISVKVEKWTGIKTDMDECANEEREEGWFISVTITINNIEFNDYVFCGNDETIADLIIKRIS